MRGGDFHGSLVLYGVVVPFTPAASISAASLSFCFASGDICIRTSLTGPGPSVVASAISHCRLPDLCERRLHRGPLRHHRSTRRAARRRGRSRSCRESRGRFARTKLFGTAVRVTDDQDRSSAVQSLTLRPPRQKRETAACGLATASLTHSRASEGQGVGPGWW